MMRYHCLQSFAGALVFAASLSFAVLPADAANLYSSGGKTWDTTTTNWGTVSGGPYTNATWNSTTPDSAIFEGTAGTVTLGEAINISNLTINTDYYTIRSNTLSFATGGRITVNSALGGNWITVATIRSAITGTPAVSLNTPANIQTAFAPTEGSVSLGVISGGGLIALGGTTSGNSIASTASSKIRVQGGVWTITGNASAYEHFIDSGTLIANGLLKCNNRSLSFAGGTLVANGTVEVPSTYTIAMSAGAALKGTGVVKVPIAVPITIPTGATIAPGYPTGKLTITNNSCTINGNLAITVDGAQNSGLAVNNTLTISSATLNVSVVNPPPVPVIIATYGTLSGQFAVTNMINSWTVDYNYEGGKAIALIPPASGTVLIIR